MPVVVEVKSEADYAAWLADQKAMKLAMAGGVEGILNG